MHGTESSYVEIRKDEKNAITNVTIMDLVNEQYTLKDVSQSLIQIKTIE